MSVNPAARWRVCLFLLAPLLAAQDRPVGRVVSAGYSAPQPVRVAPGQVLTLFVRSDGGQPAQVAIPSGLPLPPVLSGYSVALRQTYSSAPIATPLFSVYPVNDCYGLFPSVCRALTAITVQIPWELVPNIPGTRRPENFASLTVSIEGTAGEAVPLEAVPDSIHVVNSCDSTMAPGTERSDDLTGPCKPVAAHADGRLVTPANPATVGEVVVMYAFGLGQPGTDVRTGAASQGSVAIPDVTIRFDPGVNLPPARPGQSSLPMFAGLAPGEVGLYQVAFTVPSLPEGTPACTALGTGSNLTVSIGRLVSFDGAGICVDVE